jgi:hypothetical protein
VLFAQHSLFNTYVVVKIIILYLTGTIAGCILSGVMKGSESYRAGGGISVGASSAIMAIMGCHTMEIILKWKQLNPVSNMCLYLRDNHSELLTTVGAKNDIGTDVVFHRVDTSLLGTAIRRRRRSHRRSHYGLSFGTAILLRAKTLVASGLRITINVGLCCWHHCWLGFESIGFVRLPFAKSSSNRLLWLNRCD